MFVVTMKSKINKKVYKILIGTSIVFLCLAVIFAACAVFKTPEKVITCDKGEYSADLLSQNVGEFMSQFSKTVGEKVFEKLVYVPFEFNETFEEYNVIQKHQGLDLSLYKGEECTLCIYELKDYEIDYEKAYVSILIHKDTVIGGHISTYIDDGEIYTFFGE